jgi:hypothetical protein
LYSSTHETLATPFVSNFPQVLDSTALAILRSLSASASFAFALGADADRISPTTAYPSIDNDAIQNAVFVFHGQSSSTISFPASCVPAFMPVTSSGSHIPPTTSVHYPSPLMQTSAPRDSNMEARAASSGRHVESNEVSSGPLTVHQFLLESVQPTGPRITHMHRILSPKIVEQNKRTHINGADNEEPTRRGESLNHGIDDG